MKKLITSIMIILLSIICVANYSYAAGQLEATIEITPSANKVKAGESVTFTFITKNIVNAESGKIFAIGGKIEYDAKFFELDTTSGITLSEETGLFNSTNAVSEGGTNGTITLKVKADATGSGTVQFTELEASDGRLEDMETLGVATTENQTFTITIDSQIGNEEEPPVDGENGDQEEKPADKEEENVPPSDKEDDVPTSDKEEELPPEEDKNKEDQPTTEGTTVVVGGDKNDNTTSNKEIPKAGLSTILLGGIVAIIIVALIMYRKNQKYEDIK